jgi:hypothetical protein
MGRTRCLLALVLMTGGALVTTVQNACRVHSGVVASARDLGECWNGPIAATAAARFH